MFAVHHTTLAALYSTAGNLVKDPDDNVLDGDLVVIENRVGIVIDVSTEPDVRRKAPKHVVWLYGGPGFLREADIRSQMAAAGDPDKPSLYVRRCRQKRSGKYCAAFKAALQLANAKFQGGLQTFPLGETR